MTLADAFTAVVLCGRYLNDSPNPAIPGPTAKPNASTGPCSPSFNRTLLTEWAYARPWTSNSQRTRGLDQFLHRYNTQRGHSALGGRRHRQCTRSQLRAQRGSLAAAPSPAST
jgi:hypothetical protein